MPRTLRSASTASITALCLCLAGDAALAGGGDPTQGDVLLSYSCEGFVDTAFDHGADGAGATLQYDFPAGAGNFARAIASWSPQITATVIAGARTGIRLPTATAAGDCSIQAGITFAQGFSFTGSAPPTIDARLDVFLDLGITQTAGAPAATNAQFLLDVDQGASPLLSERIIASPISDVVVFQNPLAFEVTDLGGGAFSVIGSLPISFSVSTAAPLVLNAQAGTRVSVPGGTTGISVTSDFTDGLQLQVVSLTPGVTIVPFGGVPPTPDPQSKLQRKCIVLTNARGAAVANGQGKLAQSCLKDATKGKIPSAESCATAGSKSLAKLEEKLSKADAKCDDPDEIPDFAHGLFPSVAAAARGETLAWHEALLGDPIDGAIRTDKGEIACQGRLLKAGLAFFGAVLDEMVDRKDDALEAGAGTPAELAAAIQGGGAADYLQVKSVMKKHIKLFAVPNGCGGISDGSALFPGLGAGVPLAGVPPAAANAAFCAAVRYLNAADGLAIDTAAFAACP